MRFGVYWKTIGYIIDDCLPPIHRFPLLVYWRTWAISVLETNSSGFVWSISCCLEPSCSIWTYIEFLNVSFRICKQSRTRSLFYIFSVLNISQLSKHPLYDYITLELYINTSITLPQYMLPVSWINVHITM